jgi:hypothetical protein
MQDQITDNHHEVGALGVAAVAGKNAPPIAVAGMTMAGVPLQDWVYILTISWLFVQIAWFCYDKWRKIRRDMDDSQP